MANATKVFLASPYRVGNVAQNVRVQHDAFDALNNMDFIPFMPFFMHYQHLVHPKSFDNWMSWCIEWLKVCDLVLRLPGESKGSDLIVAEASRLQIPVLDTWEATQDYFQQNQPNYITASNEARLYYDRQVAIIKQLMTRSPGQSTSVNRDKKRYSDFVLVSRPIGFQENNSMAKQWTLDKKAP